MTDGSESKAAYSRLKIHFFYVTVFLIGSIVLLATSRWTGIDGFTDYLTAAGTMISIVLGVLAIIYSFVSGDSISKSLGSVSAAAADLQEARQEFSNLVTAAAGLTNASRASSVELNDVLDVVRLEVKDLRAASAKLNESTEGIAKTIGQMPERLDKIDGRLQESFKNSAQRAKTEPTADAEALTNKLLISGSNFGRALIYALALAKETGKPVLLSSKPFEFGEEYCYGFMMALGSIGILRYSVTDRENREFEVKQFNMASSIVKKVAEEALRDDATGLDSLKEMLEELDEMFSEEVVE